MGDVIHRRRPQQPVRVVDRIAGEVLRLSGFTVEDVVRHDPVSIGAHSRHHARVSRPGGAGEHALHAVRDDAALGEAPQRRHAHARVRPVEGREPVEADQDDTGHGQYGSLTKMKVVPCTMGALAPTNETLTSLTWRSPARPDACSAPSMMCQSPWMRPVLRLPPKVLRGSSPSSSMRPSWMKSSASPSLENP